VHRKNRLDRDSSGIQRRRKEAEKQVMAFSFWGTSWTKEAYFHLLLQFQLLPNFHPSFFPKRSIFLLPIIHPSLSVYILFLSHHLGKRDILLRFLRDRKRRFNWFDYFVFADRLLIWIFGMGCASSCDKADAAGEFFTFFYWRILLVCLYCILIQFLALSPCLLDEFRSFALLLVGDCVAVVKCWLITDNLIEWFVDLIVIR